MASEKNIEQVRDEVAKMLGWTLTDAGTMTVRWTRGGEYKWPEYDHPVPTELGGIIALLSSIGWRLDYLRERVCKPNPWFASAVCQHWADRAAEGETAVEAATRLVHAALTAQKGTP